MKFLIKKDIIQLAVGKNKKMKILLTGGTGFIGRVLRKELVAVGHELIVLTRAHKESSEKLTFINWDYRRPEDITAIVNNTNVVINLAGESIITKKWTKEKKEKILESRIMTTREIVNAINKAENKPKKLISTSAVGIYGNTGDEKITEESALGRDFLANVCKAWEEEAKKAMTKVVILRIGIVLGRGGGALEKMLPLFKMFLGGPLGSGNQWMSWISLDDLISLIKFAAEKDNVVGTLNATSPSPVTNEKFSNMLGKVLYRPSIFPVPGLILKLLLGEMADVLLTGQRVYPEKALQYGYTFKHTDLEWALKNIL